MKSLLLLLLVPVLAKAHFAWKNHLVNQATHNVEVVVHHLVKRHAVSDTSKPLRQKRQIACVLDCIQTMSRNMGADYKEAAGGMVNPKLFNQSKFEELCNIYKDGKRCLDICEDTRIKHTLMAAFKSLDFLCVDHYDEFIEHTGCYLSTFDTVSEECNPRCGDQNKMAILKAKQEELKKMRSIEALGQVKDILSCMCNFLDCHVSCNVPIYDEECGDTAPGEFIKEFSQTTFHALEKMMRENGVLPLWPRLTCGKIGKGQFGFAQNADCIEDFIQNDIGNEVATFFL